MAATLVTLSEAEDWVSSTQPENQALIRRLAALATGIVLDYVGPDPTTGLDRTWTVTTVPDPVRAAVLYTLADLWAHRGDEAAPAEQTWHLTPPATRCLQRYRAPVVS